MMNAMPHLVDFPHSLWTPPITRDVATGYDPSGRGTTHTTTAGTRTRSTTTTTFLATPTARAFARSCCLITSACEFSFCFTIGSKGSDLCEDGVGGERTINGLGLPNTATTGYSDQLRTIARIWNDLPPRWIVPTDLQETKIPRPLAHLVQAVLFTTPFFWIKVASS